jgi:natural product precursor
MARRPVMNKARKLELSKETLRCLDDQDLTDVAGGGGHGGGHGGGENNNSFICVSAQQANSCVCQSVLCDVL